jgi:DNA-binding transcriptional LysR family regulator
MEIKELKSFMAVVECGNFTKAAEKLMTSQPTVSTHIKALEDEFGTPLIIRDTKNMEITAQGEDLYRYACLILELKEKMVRRWKAEGENIIYIGTSSMPSAYILPEIMEGFRMKNSGISMSVHQSDTRKIVEGLENGAYDVGFVGDDFCSDCLEYEPVSEDKTVLITPKNEKYEKYLEYKELPIKEMLKAPLIFREEGSGSQKNAELILKALNMDIEDLNVIGRVNDQEAMQNFVECGMGLAFMSKMAVEEKLNAGRIMAFDLNLSQAVRTFYLALRKDSYQSPALQSFIKYVKEDYKDKL